MEINIDSISVKVTPVSREDNILAFAELRFLKNGVELPIFKIKGFTIRQKQFNGIDTITVNFPAYPAGGKLVKSFIAEDKNLYKRICEMFLVELKNQAGDAIDVKLNEERIDIDELPI